MPVNGSDFINEPWNTTWSPYTSLFERFLGAGTGMVFFLVPLIFITTALYVKTRDPVITSMFMIAGGALFSGSGMFIGAMDMLNVFTLFTAVGIASLVLSLFFRR